MSDKAWYTGGAQVFREGMKEQNFGSNYILGFVLIGPLEQNL